MKILHTVESYLPSRHGMSEVVRQLSERLAAKGHQVTVATRKDPARFDKLINGVEIVEFDVSGNITEGIQGEYDRYIQFLLNSDFDIVTNFAAQQWATDLALPILSRIRGKKVFVPTGFSALYLPKYQSYYTQMKKWLKEYEKVVYLSENYRDANFAKDLGLSNSILIPNGASEEEFCIDKDPEFRKRYGIPKNDFLVLHVSGYVGGKGHIDAIRIFSKAKLENASLLFISPDFDNKFKDQKLLSKSSMTAWIKSVIKHTAPPEIVQLKFIQRLQRLGFYRKIQFVELPRAEVIQAYKNADLFLFPSQLECSPIVLFECMASKTPFLVTEVGNAKEIIEWSGAGNILPTVKSQEGYGFSRVNISPAAVQLQNIAKDHNLLMEMSNSGYSSWIKNFTWANIHQKYDELYQTLK